MAVSKPAEARAFRLGQLLAAIECARASLEVARRNRDLLSDEGIERLHHAAELLAGVEQAAWIAKGKP